LTSVWTNEGRAMVEPAASNSGDLKPKTCTRIFWREDPRAGQAVALTYKIAPR